MKRFLMILMAVLVLTVSVAAAETVDYHINVCEPGAVWVRITSDNAADVLGDGTVSYNASTNTLTLNNASLLYISGHSDAAENQRIELIGRNTVITPDTEQMFSISYFDNLEIFGSGSLTVSNSFVDADGYGYPCIQTEGDLTFKGATVEATSKDNTAPIYCIGDMHILNDAFVTVHAGNFPGLNAANLHIMFSRVDIDSTSHGVYVPGQLNIGGDSEVNIEAGDNGVALESGDDILIGGGSKVKLSGGWGIWSINGGVKIADMANLDIDSKTSAIVNTPDLSEYDDPSIFAGASENQMNSMSPDSNYFSQQHMTLESKPAAVPKPVTPPDTGDGFNVILWCGMLLLSAAMMIMMKRRYN